MQGLKFLRTAAQNSSALDEGGFAVLANLLTSLRPDLVVIDPLIALCGGGNINDNAVMSLVMRELKRVAIKHNCAILIVLHTRKGGDLTTADAISGASAIKDLARHAIMPVTMTEAEAKAFGILPSERRQHFKLVDAKSNLAPLSGETWYKLENQELPNAEPPTYQHGDRVQAVVQVKLTPSKASTSVGLEQQTIRFELLRLIERGITIDGETVPYSPNSTGNNKMRAILDEAIGVVKRVSADREYAPSDLRAVADGELEALKRERWVVVEKIEKGRFRRSQGLRPVWERTPWAKEREALREHGGPTVRIGGPVGTSGGYVGAPAGGVYGGPTPGGVYGRPTPGYGGPVYGSPSASGGYGGPAYNPAYNGAATSPWGGNEVLYNPPPPQISNYCTTPNGVCTSVQQIGTYCQCADNDGNLYAGVATE